jgi:hypothetical protein
MSNPNEPTWEDYTAAVQRYLASIDAVLAAGDRAQQRMAEFYRRHGLEPGSGERALTSPSLPAAEREANRRVLALREALARAAQPSGPTPVPAPPLPPAAAAPRVTPSLAARALGHRNRI